MEDDPFDAINDLNKNAYESGFKDGLVEGKRAAIRTGFQIGQKVVFNLLNEIGQYYSACELYRLENLAEPPADAASNTETPMLKPNANSKAYKLAGQICDIINKFDMLDCHTDSFMQNIEHIRDKYKQFCSLTSTKNIFSKQHLTSVKLSF